MKHIESVVNEIENIEIVINDFPSDLKDISVDVFEKRFINTLYGERNNLKVSNTLYVYFLKSKPNGLIILNFKKKVKERALVTEEKLPAFYSSSVEGRKAFYEAHILKPIRQLYQETK